MVVDWEVAARVVVAVGAAATTAVGLARGGEAEAEGRRAARRVAGTQGAPVGIRAMAETEEVEVALWG